MSLEVTCKICGEEFDMRHGICPACVWRIKRVTQLEAENERLKEALNLIAENGDNQNAWDFDNIGIANMPIPPQKKPSEVSDIE